MRSAALFLAALVINAWSVATGQAQTKAPDITGIYRVVGVMANGKVYHAKALIRKTEETYRVLVKSGDDGYEGTGLLDGDCLAVTWAIHSGEKLTMGVSLFRIDGGGRLVGRWTTAGGVTLAQETLFFVERLPPAEAGPAPTMRDSSRAAPPAIKSKLKVFNCADGSFSVLMPDAPIKKSFIDFGDRKMHILEGMSETDRLFSVRYLDLPDVPTEEEAAFLIEKCRDGILAGTKGTLIKSAATPVGTPRGIDFEAELPGGARLRCRIFTRDDRFYVLSVGAFRDRDEHEDRQFLDSLRLLRVVMTPGGNRPTATSVPVLRWRQDEVRHGPAQLAATFVPEIV